MLSKVFAILLVLLMSVSSSLFGECSFLENDTLPDNHLVISMNIMDDRLEGSSEFLQGFTFTMQVPGEFQNSAFDYPKLLTLIRNNTIVGTLIYPTGKVTEIQYEVVNHRGKDDIYMKTTLGYFLWECADIKDNHVLFVINWWYYPPVREVDLKVIEMTRKLLADSSSWHKEDDRKCDDDIKDSTWSLFCALKHSSINLMKEYNHHNTAMQTVRFVIDEIKADHGYAHTLMDYNNDSATSHKDILQVLNLAEKRLMQKQASEKPNQDKE